MLRKGLVAQASSLCCVGCALRTLHDYGIEKEISSTDETIDQEFRSRFKVEPPPSAVLAFIIGAAGHGGTPNNERVGRALPAISWWPWSLGGAGAGVRAKLSFDFLDQ